jgi:AraC-like DNA-binding protein
MLPKFEKVPTDKSSTIFIHQPNEQNFPSPWHFHPEIEIMYVQKSSGMRFVGDSIENFEPGDLVMVGSNLPHTWRNGCEYYVSSSELTAKAIVVQFSPTKVLGVIARMPELMEIQKLLASAIRGIEFKQPFSIEAGKRLMSIYRSDGAKRLLLFLDLLHSMAQTNQYRLLASPGFMQYVNYSDADRINKVYSYIMSNFTGEISLNHAADLANMTPTAFCRYFKSRTFKTFSTVVNQVRLGYACRLLLDGKHTIGQACYESGFNNFSNFSRQFRKQVHMGPSEYLRRRT